ncbi:APC family permease [Kaistella sp. G5-32]|uniref:APC family permease n=1 Tax=Kaistella gelatinilytica TaxID=2787636 RepID=A0ABS0FBK5_9FLAO|nr:APC family permease [Kaistella gelatinilytica]MBF8457098.1 APC family permease [Kaistella gelatinilytica]
MSNDQKLEAKYGLFTAISMVIGQVIGSGIFFKVDDVLQATQGNILAGLLGFLIVGISVVFAGISMANYAEILPKDGGILSYVNYRFGETASYFVGWMYMSLFYPALTAVLFTVSGIYIAHLLAEFMNFEPTFLHFALIGFVNLIIFFFINIFRPRSSGIFQQLTTVLKVMPLILIASLGILSLFKGDVNQVNTFSEVGNGLQNQSFILLVAASFIPISFAFDGWYIATQISGEIKNSSKNLPKALIIGTISVMVIYIAYYLGIVFRMSGNEIIQLKDTYITEFARKIASNSGALIMQLFIIISVLGTSNGLLLATIRVPYQFANLEKSKKFLNLDKVNEKTKMPVNSTVFGTTIIIFYILVYYFTNTHPFFTERNFDISAIPIVFIYLVNGALFLGLFQLLKKNVFPGNRFFKATMATIAVLGNLVVLFGTATAPNGITYFIINILFILAGFLLMRKN